MRSEDSIAEFWPQGKHQAEPLLRLEFLEVGKKHFAGETAREATPEVVKEA